MSYHCDHQLHHHHHNHYHHHHHYDQGHLFIQPMILTEMLLGRKICECGRTLKTDYDQEVNPALFINIAPTVQAVFKLFSLQRHHLQFIDNWKTKFLWVFSLWLDGLCLTWCCLSSLLWDLPCTVLVRGINENCGKQTNNRGVFWNRIWFQRILINAVTKPPCSCQ